MTSTRARPDARARAAIVVGVAASFVTAVDLVRLARPRLLLDPEPGWAIARVALGLAVAAAAAAAGGVFGAAFRVLSPTRLLSAPLLPLPFPRRAVALITVAAVGAGLLLRLRSAETLPVPFLEDEVNLVTPALGLTGTARDFADAIRPIPYGRPDPHEMIGVLFLRLLRLSLDSFGTTVLAIRVPSLLGGALSLLTATLLARALLPQGGVALAALVLAGLRWHIILSLSGWHAILLVPLVDAAALLLLRARRLGSIAPATLAGIVAGIGSHFYLAAWVAGVGLLAFGVWPTEETARPLRRLARAGAFAAGFLIAAAPLFLFHEGRRIPYFGRASRHSVVREMRIAGSPMPALAAAADAIPAPWFLPDPEGRHDLEGASRLGWVVGIPLAVALARALLAPRGDLSALLLTQGGAAFCAAVAGGQAGHPNGFRFGYLTSATAVAAAAGALALIGLASAPRRRAVAIAAVGILAIAGARGADQALAQWPARQATFDSFHGEDTLLGRSAARWERYGRVAVETGLGRSDLTIDTVRRYRLDPAVARGPGPEGSGEARSRSFRIAAATRAPLDGERVVERVRDAWGRDWATVFGRRDAPL